MASDRTFSNYAYRKDGNRGCCIFLIQEIKKSPFLDMHLSIHMMMAVYLSKLILVSMLLLPVLVTLFADSYSPSVQPVLCHARERSALLQFKAGFVIDKFASSDPLAYPKVLSWSLRGDCCSWDGVDCDYEGDGHVIGLDLSSSYLFGSINSNSSLFELKHLQWLSLADNNFSYSPIPPELALVSTTLTHLNLSRSHFAGQIPSQVSMLSRLIVLDLSNYIMFSSSATRYLQLKRSTFTNLVQNMSKLEFLDLSYVNISSTVPNMLSNLSSLSTLYLRGCNLVGEFPSSVFLLPNIQYISLLFNKELTGYLPEFSWSPLKVLSLRHTSFSGALPDSIQNLHSLTDLDVSECNFSGPIPSSFGNLTNLTNLHFTRNYFTLGDLSWLGQLNNLQSLFLGGNNISSHEIPYSLSNLVNLKVLSLQSCHLTGEIPFWIQSLTQLTSLDLSVNFLHGPVRASIFSKLVSLEVLILSKNNLSGRLEFSMFHEMLNLTILSLGTNHLTVVDYYNGTLPNLEMLDLDSCNLHKFPNFLNHQQNLQRLYLANNIIDGPMPGWFCNTSKQTLQFLDVSNNLLTSLEQCSNALSWVNLYFLDLNHNLLGGSLPSPPPSINFYYASDNRLEGEIPSLLCNLSSLSFLHLSHNNFSGELPRCLGNMTTLSLLTLNNNNFSGTIPQMCIDVTSKMVAMNFAENQLHGKMPTSLANCAMLRSLNVGHNQIDDTFPFWMGKLDFLQLLILRSNRFHGAVESYVSTNTSEFLSLRIIDLSHNGFSGHLPSSLFHKWKAMEISNPVHFSYMGTNTGIIFTMILVNKGIEMDYERIPNVFAAIDFSSNNFSGQVPESMGNLNGLYLLNLSNNHLAGDIPPSLANLTVLESLDLSNNKLSGQIPQQLAQLNFLAYFNVSRNNLTGQVPRGRQFDTFQDNSFDGNSRLCGELLIKEKCKGHEPTPPSPISCDKCEDDESVFPGKSDWIAVMMGCACGLVVGFVMGNELMAKKPEWFVKVFGRNMQPQRRKGRRSRIN